MKAKRFIEMVLSWCVRCRCVEAVIGYIDRLARVITLYRDNLALVENLYQMTAGMGREVRNSRVKLQEPTERPKVRRELNVRVGKQGRNSIKKNVR